MSKDDQPVRQDTLIVNAGRHPERYGGAVNPPVFRASTVLAENRAGLARPGHSRYDRFSYGRYGTPTTSALEEAVAALEGGHRAIAMSSGLAAIAGTLMGMLKLGDHVLVSDNVYFPTRRLCDRLRTDWGVDVTYFDPRIGSGIAELMQASTRLVMCESPGSLTFEVQDIPAIAAAAHEAGALVAIDNTWGTPLFFKPFEKGCDISIQAATKYIVGHADAMLGTITVNGDDLYYSIKERIAALGYGVGSDDAYLGLRGLRTLSARLARHQESALRIATWLEGREEVAEVLYPALPSHPDHALWQRDFTGACGLFGLVLRPAPDAAVTAMVDGYRHFPQGYSWGGFESLVVVQTDAVIRTAVPWSGAGPLLRYHIGLEDPLDLIADLEAGFDRLRGKA